MPASNQPIIDNINNKLTVGGLTDQQAAQLAGAVEGLCGAFYSVDSLASLPSAALNKGRFVFIKELDDYRYSDGSNWISRYSTNVPNLLVWGGNSFAQLGDGTTSPRSRLTSVVGGGVNWSSVSTKTAHTLATKSDGTLWTWGQNGSGRLGDGTTTARSSPGTVSGGGTTWRSISTGAQHSVAVKNDGTLWTWGYNLQGQLGDGTTTARSSPVTVSGGGTNWCSVAAGDFFTVALKTDGTLWAWGANTNGAVGDGTATNRSSPVTVSGGGTTWRRIAAGACHTVAIKTDGSLWAWGQNAYGQVGDNSLTVRSSPVSVVGGDNNWLSVSAGQRHTIGLKNNGTIWTWGCNTQGQLGDGTTTQQSSPVSISGGGTNWCAISAGRAFSLGIKTDGSLWSWGCNNFYQLADQTIINRSSPVPITEAGSNWLSVSAAECNAAGIRSGSGF